MLEVRHPHKGIWVVTDPADPDPGGWTPSFPGEPAPGTIYYGFSSASDKFGTSGPQARETQLGVTVGCYRSYGSPGESIASNLAKIQDSLNGNRLPLHSTKPPGSGSWYDVANGSQDAWIQQITDGMKAMVKPIWWCVHHEPYDDGVGGKNWNGDPNQTTTNFRAMYDRLYQFTKNSNIVLMPVLQSAPFSPSVGGKQDIGPWIPASCDIIGLDTYNHWYPLPGKSRWREPSVCFGDALNAVASYGKKVVMAEYGVRTDPANPGRAAQWMRDAKAYLLSTGVTVAMSYFDSDRNVNDANPKDGTAPPPPWDLEYAGTVASQIREIPANGFVGGPERLNAFKELLLETSTAHLP